jgi:myo-inositol-1(or 4)-monophosphatase
MPPGPGEDQWIVQHPGAIVQRLDGLHVFGLQGQVEHVQVLGDPLRLGPTGCPTCSVSLALMHRGGPVVAVTHAPLLSRTYHGIKDSGAFLNGEPISVSGTKRLNAAIVSLGDYAVGPEAATLNQQRMALTAELIPRVERIRMIGAATLDLAFVAEGALDACVMMSNKPWDTAAGTLIAREAGAHITDAYGNPHTYQSASTVATAAAITDELATVIQTTIASSTQPAGATA